MVPELDITVDATGPENDLRRILDVIKPDWKSTDIQIKKCPGSGCINPMFLATVADDDQDGVVLRIWCDTWNALFTREREKAVTRLYNERGISPKIYCSFQNGVAMRYIKGLQFTWESLDSEPLVDEKVLRAAAREFAMFHSSKTSDLAIKTFGLVLDPSVPETRRFYGLVEQLFPEELQDPEANVLLQSSYPKKSQILFDWQRIMENIEACGIPTVLCHHDGHPANSIYVTEEDRLYFVDYELSSFDYQCIDLATFLEFSATGLSHIDAAGSRRHPLALRKILFREYLETQRLLGDIDHDITDHDVMRLHVWTEKCTLAVWLYYSFLALIVASDPKNQYMKQELWVRLALDEYSWISANIDRILAMEVP